MSPPPVAASSQRDATEPENHNDDSKEAPELSSLPSRRRDSMSQQSEGSQTAAEFIRDQMQLEADAREALPYSFKNCTRPLGSLRQNIYACLTCNPPPAQPDDAFAAAGICYSCSVQCHGDHELVEIFKKRNFTCDCGTTRFRPDQPCTLRLDPATNTRGHVHSEPADPANRYTQNFRNRFCSCSVDYRPDEQAGTMFQCLGLGTLETGGCGEEWYHPGCLVGQGPKWYERMPSKGSLQDSLKGSLSAGTGAALASHPEDAALEPASRPPVDDANDAQLHGDHGDHGDHDEDVPLPDGFPDEEEFSFLLCYKCVEANPWIKRYAGAPGFLPAIFLRKPHDDAGEPLTARKRKMVEEEQEEGLSNADGGRSKRIKGDPDAEFEGGVSDSTVLTNTPMKMKDEHARDATELEASDCKLLSFPPAPDGVFSLFLKADFRDHMCHCPSCFPHLKPHPQLLEQEDDYEPTLSDASDNGSTHGSGSLYERGESALKNVDRVRAIEGVMAYNNLKEKLKPFFQQFAESGKAIGAEDIKQYFAKLRGDEQAIQEAGDAAVEDHRREQSGY
ncbi:putative zinc finger in N-recognin-domain-containing protein [Nemania sp. FL0916]|nr:putative zinc finger in N-recognin-domain-containing protein [Nemania sp. FL0916]